MISLDFGLELIKQLYQYLFVHDDCAEIIQDERKTIDPVYDDDSYCLDFGDMYDYEDFQ